MRAVLRLASMASNPPLPPLNPNAVSSSSLRLTQIAHQLLLYRPPPPPPDDDVDDRGKVFSPLGLADSSTPPLPDPSRHRRAAVLICLFQDRSGDLRVILTKRSSNLSTHSGEVALPGGKADECDADDKETATREAKEEIGLDPSHVNIVTVLEPFLSKHLLRVVPVIGILFDRELFHPVINTAEVETIFDAPLEMFLKDENRIAKVHEWMGYNHLIQYFDYNAGDKKFMIWGLTASILIRAASVVYQRPPAFSEISPSSS